MDSKRLIWTVVVLGFAVMAVMGPYKMVRRSLSAGQSAQPSSNPTVSMAGFVFTPQELTVPRGTEVLFDNDDVAPHTVTSDDKSVDSGLLNPGKAFKLVVNGSLDYICAIHPNMTGKIVLAG
jgi:plastocyanin